jgi:hypothetical protein
MDTEDHWEGPKSYFADYGLLFERDNVFLKRVNAELPFALVQSKEYHPGLVGKVSGRQSVLVCGSDINGADDSEVFRIKGYRVHDRRFIISLETAVDERDATEWMDERLSEHGFIPVTTSRKIIEGNLPSEGYQAGERIGIVVYQVVGDTRFSELCILPERNVNAAEYLAYEIGRHIGALVRTTKDFDPQNTNIGDYVIFTKHGYLGVGRTNFTRRHTPRIPVPCPIIESYVQRYKASKRIRSLCQSLAKPVHAGRDVTRGFVMGYNEGYKDPDSREVIPMQLLHEAYGIKARTDLI